MNKVNERVEADFIQTVFGEGQSVLVINWLAIYFAAPQLELVEQVVQGAVTELVQNYLLEAQNMSHERQLYRKVSVVDIDVACSLGDQVNEGDPVVIRCHLGHQV